jgi:choline-glycine betaine transporter
MGLWNDLFQGMGETLVESAQISAAANAMAEELKHVHPSAWANVMIQHATRAYRSLPHQHLVISKIFTQRLGRLEEESPDMDGVQAAFVVANIAAMAKLTKTD